MNMSKSEDYLYRCLDVIRMDKNISEQTLIIMFTEYAKLVLEEKPNNWKNKNIKPNKPGRYIVRKRDGKIYLETFSGLEWSCNLRNMTHWCIVNLPINALEK